MSDLDRYFATDTRARDSHPLVRLLDEKKCNLDFGSAKVEMIRPRAALGFEPAQLILHLYDPCDQRVDCKTEPWDPELNDALLDRGIRAIDEANETQRFGLALAAALQHSESRYGDGFFSTVLMQVVDQSPFAETEPIHVVRRDIHTNRPFDSGHAVQDCREMIQAVLHDRWIELRRNLNYEKNAAERILAGALAYYLDERFGITDGRNLGWLKAM